MARARIQLIDAFRGVAILLVLFYHFLVRWAPARAGVDLYQYDRAYPAMLDLGAHGVQIFFVISGLVITMTALRAASPLEFGVRRFARLYPAFFVACTGLFLATKISGPAEFRTYLPDYFASLSFDPQLFHRSYVAGVFWTLTVEVKFYLWVALSRWLLGERFWLGVVAFGAVGVALPDAARVAAIHIFLAPQIALFILGIGAWYLLFERQARIGWTCIASALAIYAVAALRHNLNYDPGFEVWRHALVLGASAAMLALLRWAPELKPGALAWIGRISYSLYLTHEIVGVTLIGVLNRAGAPDMVTFILAAASSIALAAALYYGVETPGQRWVMKAYRGLSARRAQTAH